MFRRKNLLMSAALVLCGALTMQALAQTAAPQTMKPTEDFRRQAPAPLAQKQLNIPKPYEVTLPNGLQLVVVEDHRLPLVSYRLALRTGNVEDPAGMPGLTVMMTGLLNEGTEKRSSKQIADEVARLGATLAAGSNADYTTVAASALAMYNDQVMDLLADIALHPSFPENELALAKQNTKQGLLQQRAQPSFLASERLSQVIFGSHPYSIVGPSNESVDAITRERLISFHRAMFIPNNAVMVVVGDVKHEDIEKKVRELFGSWAKGQAPEDKFTAPPVRTARTLYVVDRPGSQQSNIVIANLGINRTSADYFPMLVMHTVLGANASSRLFMNLREAKGYTYGAYSNLDTRRFAGTFRSTAEVRTPVTGASLKEFFYELERIRTDAVSDKEIKDAKSYLTGVFPIRLETQEGLTDQLVQLKMFDLPADYLQNYRDRVNAVTVADIQRVAQTYITPDKVAIVIVGDAGAIMDQIKPYAQTIEIYDAAGHRKELSATANNSNGNTATNGVNMAGTWELQITGPGGNVLPATLTIKQEGGNITGTVQMPQLGNGTLSNAKISGNNFDATLTLDANGQNIEALVNGTADKDQMKGTITVTSIPNIPPLPFNGTRKP